MSGLAGLWWFSCLWSVFAVWAVLSVVSRFRVIFDLSEQSINPDLCVSLSLSLSFTPSLNLKCSLFVSQCFYFSQCSVVRHGSALLPNGCCLVGHTNSSGPKAPKNATKLHPFSPLLTPDPFTLSQWNAACACIGAEPVNLQYAVSETVRKGSFIHETIHSFIHSPWNLTSKN